VLGTTSEIKGRKEAKSPASRPNLSSLAASQKDMPFLETRANRELLSDSRAFFLTVDDCTPGVHDFNVLLIVGARSTQAHRPD
jgi:hypothetical protein